ncbi:type III pantothenate kinase [Myroides indicus]|uniref:Type III pantothenate kinase n=1 Tax=Myroides indicus TaxID=1323422 RepID=A0A4R7EWA8_9FLAO|nr:type III pantothenate kinase [Myroides indicus]TDS56555.1 type III pantothenate kinase [Myroides indicus]
MILAIDIGNTRTKIAWFENNSLKDLSVIENGDLLQKIQKFSKKAISKITVILSSVGKLDQETLFWLSENTFLYIVSHQSALPFKNLYATPTTLGIDRIVLAAGAVLSYPSSNRLVIDAGTCITYDFINDKNEYLGGSISPGIQLRYKSLNDYTVNLPLLSPEPINFLTGNSTSASIHSGVINGVTAEIDNIIHQYKGIHSNLTVILTGGDTVFLAKRLKNIIFANSNFLIESLNALYQYTIENDK